MRLSTVIVTLALASLPGLAPIASAGPLAFGVNADGDLYSIDLGAATTTFVGSTGVSFLEGLALSPDGRLFATDFDGLLYSIDPLTAAATFVADTGIGNIEALDFLGSTLVGLDFADTPTAYAFDTVTGAATPLVTPDTMTGSIRSGTVSGPDSMLIRGDVFCPTQCLYSLTLSTGAVTAIGGLGGGPELAALDFATDGLLYGLYVDGSLVTVDPLTALTTPIGDVGNLAWLALAAAPQSEVPEPATLALLGAGLVAGARRIRRRRGQVLHCNISARASRFRPS